MMKNFKKGIYFMTGIAYVNSFWERMRTEGWLKKMFSLSDPKDELGIFGRSVVTLICATLGVIFWPFLLVLDLTTKWDK